MFSPRIRICPAIALLFCVAASMTAAADNWQLAQLPGEPEEEMHHHGHHEMMMNLPSGVSGVCAPQFTYGTGMRGPLHWPGVCNTGRMQAPIDISSTQKIPIPPLPPLQLSYQPVPLDIVNDCNHSQLKLRFPPNLWLKTARKPYRLSEIVFRAPGENAINGERPPMSLELVHLSPESTILVIEASVKSGRENPAISAILSHVPAPGQEQVTNEVKISAAELLPSDHGFYRFPGSLTAPVCNEGVTWFVLKHPIEMSEAQIAQLKKYYPANARPLQPLNHRPVIESE